MNTPPTSAQKRTLILIGGVAGAIAALLIVAAVVALNDEDKSELVEAPTATATPADDDTAAEPEPELEPEPGGEPTDPAGEVEVITALDTGAPRYWKVAGTDDALNVRLEPGTSGTVLTTLASDHRQLLSTGSRVSIDGTEWLQVQLDDGGLGWVSAQYLDRDDGPLPIPDHWDCWTGRNTRYAVSLLFDNAEEAEFVEAIMRSDFEDGTEMAYVRVLDRTDSSLRVRVSQTDGSKEKTTWTVAGDALTIDADITVQHVSCHDVAGYLPDMYAMWATE